jgi:hypothetical protein
MKTVILIVQGQDVKPYTGIAYKETNLAPYFSNLRRMPVEEAEVSLAGSYFFQ